MSKGLAILAPLAVMLATRAARADGDYPPEFKLTETAVDGRLSLYSTDANLTLELDWNPTKRCAAMLTPALATDRAGTWASTGKPVATVGTVVAAPPSLPSDWHPMALSVTKEQWSLPIVYVCKDVGGALVVEVQGAYDPRVVAVLETVAGFVATHHRLGPGPRIDVPGLPPLHAPAGWPPSYGESLFGPDDVRVTFHYRAAATCASPNRPANDIVRRSAMSPSGAEVAIWRNDRDRPMAAFCEPLATGALDVDVTVDGEALDGKRQELVRTAVAGVLEEAGAATTTPATIATAPAEPEPAPTVDAYATFFFGTVMTGDATRFAGHDNLYGFGMTTRVTVTGHVLTAIDFDLAGSGFGKGGLYDMRFMVGYGRRDGAFGFGVMGGVGGDGYAMASNHPFERQLPIEVDGSWRSRFLRAEAYVRYQWVHQRDDETVVGTELLIGRRSYSDKPKHPKVQAALVLEHRWQFGDTDDVIGLGVAYAEDAP